MVRSFFCAVCMLGLAACAASSDPPAPDSTDDDLTAPAQNNCGAFSSAAWRAPRACVCKGPNGETAWTGSDGVRRPISCDDLRLQACPSTSGVGCYLAGVRQTSAGTSAGVSSVVTVHVDIGGHMHDLCCAQHYGLKSGAGYRTRCNGCTGGDPAGTQECAGTTVVGSRILNMPYNAAEPCAVEWNYATNAPFATEVRWFSPFDTSLRWTPRQVVDRAMGSGSYGRPDDAARPLFGGALAPRPGDPTDHRAPPGTVLGPEWLSMPYASDSSQLGLTAAQIGSFCASGHATLERGLWVNFWRCQ